MVLSMAALKIIDIGALSVNLLKISVNILLAPMVEYTFFQPYGVLRSINCTVLLLCLCFISYSLP